MLIEAGLGRYDAQGAESGLLHEIAGIAHIGFPEAPRGVGFAGGNEFHQVAVGFGRFLAPAPDVAALFRIVAGDRDLGIHVDGNVVQHAGEQPQCVVFGQPGKPAVKLVHAGRGGNIVSFLQCILLDLDALAQVVDRVGALALRDERGQRRLQQGADLVDLGEGGAPGGKIECTVLRGGFDRGMQDRGAGSGTAAELNERLGFEDPQRLAQRRA